MQATASSLSEYIEHTIDSVDDENREGVLYRGHANKMWVLRPGLGRHAYSGVDANSARGRQYRSFETEAKGESLIYPAWCQNEDWYEFERVSAFVAKGEFPNLGVNMEHLRSDLDLMAYIQHHGVPTRLLDWTLNPLVALFFACCSCDNNDGIVFCYTPDRHNMWSDENRPFLDFDERLQVTAQYDVAILSTTRFFSRINKQDSLFTFHLDPSRDYGEEIVSEHCRLVAIPHGKKKNILQQLAHAGISKHRLFPGEDSLSEHIVSTYSKRLDSLNRSKTYFDLLLKSIENIENQNSFISEKFLEFERRQAKMSPLDVAGKASGKTRSGAVWKPLLPGASADRDTRATCYTDLCD